MTHPPPKKKLSFKNLDRRMNSHDIFENFHKNRISKKKARQPWLVCLQVLLSNSIYTPLPPSSTWFSLFSLFRKTLGPHPNSLFLSFFSRLALEISRLGFLLFLSPSLPDSLFPSLSPPAIPFRLRPPRCSLFVPGNLASGFPCLSIQTIKF